MNSNGSSGGFGSYEMFKIGHPDYSHMIMSNINIDYIVAYRDRITGEWELTDILMETRPETLDKPHIITKEFWGWAEQFERDHLIELLGEEKVFLALL